MQAAEAKLQKVLEGSKQFLVPHYQRPYSWGEKQWADLWHDVLQLMEEDAAQPHFIGSIVTSPARSVPEGVEKRLLIDGQQRLTTLLILLALVRDRAKKSGAENVAAKIQDLYLTNQHESGQDVYKLLPTQGEDIELSDRHNFVRVIRGEPPNPKTPIGMACHYFERAMSKEGAPPPEALHRILVNRLTLVSIILDDQDNPHRIFESLNGKGRPLSQADLIRNYFFMRIDESLHEQTYVELWRPMQERLGEEQLTAFVRHLLTSGSTIVRETDVYSALKAKVDGDKSRGPLEHLKDLVRASHFYEALLRPEKETRGAIRERLARLNRLEVTVAYPFLLGVYDDLALGKLTEADVCSVLDTVENFIVRRFVCAVPTYGLNKIFAPLYPQAAEKPVFAAAVQKILATKGYPRDAQFRERLESARLYGGGDRREKTKLLLERIEESFGHKEQVLLDALTIEHILPQTVTEAWKVELGPAWETDHEELLHTLGNLTLTNYNSELCNDSFNEKKELYAESHVELNKYFSTLSSWNAQAIERRAETLAEKALALWPYFGPEQEVETEAVTVTGRVPQTVTIRTQISPVRSWVDVAVATMEAIAQLGDGEFDRVVSEMPRFVNRDRGAFRKSSRLRTITNGAHLETNLSAQAIYRLVLQATQIVGWGPDDWRVTHQPAIAPADRDEDEDAGITETTEAAALRHEFWIEVRSALAKTEKFSSLRVPRTSYWFDVALGRSNIWMQLTAGVEVGRIGVKITMNAGVADRALQALTPQRSAIESEIGVPLDWNPHPEKKLKTIKLVRIGDIRDRSQWPELIGWMSKTAVAFRAAFAPRIADLDLSTAS